MERDFKKLKDQISSVENILLLTHKNPDGDACGSLLSMLIYLESLGKNVGVFTTGLLPKYYDFLPRIEKFSDDNSVFQNKWQMIIILDSGKLSRSGAPEEFIQSLDKEIIVNIDHHISNNHFGQLTLIDSGASSTSEIVYRFFKVIDFKIEKEIATCLLTGILDDTGGLVNAATSEESISIASDLIHDGAKMHHIMENLIHNKSITGLKLWGLLLSRLKTNKKLGFAYTYIKEEEFRQHQAKEEDVEGLVDFLNVIVDTKVVAFFRIFNNETKVSLRTTRDDIDMTELAGFYDGGGHQKAAGFSIPYQVEDIEEILKSAIVAVDKNKK